MPPAVHRWTLDLPRDGAALDVTAGCLRLQGWLLLRQEALGEPPFVVWRAEGAAGSDAVQRQAFNNGRPDVIQRVLGEPPSGHAQLRCGFTVEVPLPVRAIELGFGLPDGQVFWAVSLQLRDGPRVLEGSDGWLFLDNDTNRSVDQFTGDLRLDEEGLRRWQRYLADVRQLALQMRMRHALLIAPSKEEVLRQQYPHARAAQTVLDQVCSLAQPEDGLVDGAKVLAAAPSPQDCFKRTDTHWTDRGAWRATLAALQVLGLDTAPAVARCSDDAYRMEPYVGDLGGKLVPARSAPTEFLDGPPPEEGAVFDNRLPNIGRVIVFDGWPQPCFEQRLLVFGASSAYPMLKYLKRLFRRTVFVHSAGKVDSRVVEHERPDLLLCQSTARFLIEPPSCDFVLADAVRTKLAEAGPAWRAEAASRSLAVDPLNVFYARLLEPDHGA
ncbi:alginate O-acetyltransferase AlgX-related protein [Aquabacterium sp. J223]|uniref:alginate O-acetyltransferase AlgX-related protein n=1 Tax=Aquabacterium sp. J223 TaxID=2898431 RepID=UPI0021AE0269|nr:hypothetical protein [Aquabacterium sp. J223]UUX94131.1 hypothetical protein LRS07_12320 [Aquabacterium sp. J223]